MKAIPNTSATTAKSLDCGKTHGRNWAYSGTYSVATTEDPSARNTSKTSTYATFAAMKLSMIVVMTSLASVYAFSAPGIAPQNPPPTAPARIPRTISASPATGPAGSSGAAASTVSAVASPPTTSWPCVQMLNRPARNATATESPVKISRVVSDSVSPSERLNVVQPGLNSPGSPA